MGLVRWFAGSLVRWFAGSLVRWFAGSLVRWFAGYLVIWLFGYLVSGNTVVSGRKNRETDRLTDFRRPESLGKIELAEN